MTESKTLETIKYEIKDRIATVTLNRPDIRNAFNDTMLLELLETFKHLKQLDDLRVVVLTGSGKSFCAGADINWMRRVMDFSFDENYEESIKVAELMYLIYTFPKPVIGRINGAAIGGGTGLVAVCDVVFASTEAVFSFSEVKLGLVPACISPFIVRRVGEAKVREYFISGERLTAEKAQQCTLANYVYPPEELDTALDAFIKQLLSSGPQAIATCKKLIRDVTAISLEQSISHTAKVLAEIRCSKEGQEGMNAFLEKRKAPWNA